jgi:hypothetical protein
MVTNKILDIAMFSLGKHMWIVFLLCSGLLTAQTLDFNASINRSVVNLNEQFELTLELSGAQANTVLQPGAPDLSGFASYVGSSQSQNIQLINGKMSVSTLYAYHYIAKKAGKFTIPEVQVVHEGKSYKTKPIAVEIVTRQATRPPQGQRQGSANRSEDLSDKLFLKATADKKRIFQNEQVIVTYKIYTAINVTNYGISQLPNTVGFWAEEFENPKRLRLYNENINGRNFRVAELKKFALFPQGPGKKTLDPLVLECEVELPRSKRKSDPFNSFFNDSFFRRTVRRNISSNILTIDVLPLPVQNKPADFSGLVGNFTIRASVDKNKVKTNEAVTLRVKISGSGNVKIIPEPEISFPGDFESYDPKIVEDIKKDGNRIFGSKSFEYVIIPRFAGAQVIKPISLVYFDLRTESYKRVTTQPLEIEVKKGDQQFVGIGMGSSKEDVKFIGQDIRFIQMRIPEFKTIGAPFYKKIYFYLFLLLPLFGLAGAFGYRRHRDKLASNVAYARSRKANNMANRRLKTALKKMHDSRQAEFYSEVSKALMGFIGDKFNTAPAGLSTEEVEKLLRTGGIDDAVVMNYIECLQICDYRRFAPADSDNGAMNAFFDKSKKAIINLDKVL